MFDNMLNISSHNYIYSYSCLQYAQGIQKGMWVHMLLVIILLITYCIVHYYQQFADSYSIRMK